MRSREEFEALVKKKIESKQGIAVQNRRAWESVAATAVACFLIFWISYLAVPRLMGLLPGSGGDDTTREIPWEGDPTKQLTDEEWYAIMKAANMPHYRIPTLEEELIGEELAPFKAYLKDPKAVIALSIKPFVRATELLDFAHILRGDTPVDIAEEEYRALEDRYGIAFDQETLCRMTGEEIWAFAEEYYLLCAFSYGDISNYMRKWLADDPSVYYLEEYDAFYAVADTTPLPAYALLQGWKASGGRYVIRFFDLKDADAVRVAILEPNYGKGGYYIVTLVEEGYVFSKPVDPPPMPESLRTEIEQYFRRKNYHQFVPDWCEKNGSSNEADRYYGTYRNCVVYFSGGQLAMMSEETIAGYHFDHSANFVLNAYYDGQEYSLKKAYEIGLITEAEIKEIAHLHAEYNAFY